MLVDVVVEVDVLVVGDMNNTTSSCRITCSMWEACLTLDNSMFHHMFLSSSTSSAVSSLGGEAERRDDDDENESSVSESYTSNDDSKDDENFEFRPHNERRSSCSVSRRFLDRSRKREGDMTISEDKQMKTDESRNESISQLMNQMN